LKSIPNLWKSHGVDIQSEVRFPVRNFKTQLMAQKMDGSQIGSLVFYHKKKGQMTFEWSMKYNVENISSRAI
jgi:hypothetical protein